MERLVSLRTSCFSLSGHLLLSLSYNAAASTCTRAFTTENIHHTIFQQRLYSASFASHHSASKVPGYLEYSCNINGRPFDIMRARLINYVLFRNPPHNFNVHAQSGWQQVGSEWGRWMMGWIKGRYMNGSRIKDADDDV